MSDNGLVFDGDTAYVEGGGVKWYPQADGSPAHTSPPPIPAEPKDTP